MKLLTFFFCVAVFIGSPLWTSVLIAMLPRRLLALAYGICAIQALLAGSVWWFFWGGGIGGEAHLSKSWQFAFGFALLPFCIYAFRFWHSRHNADVSNDVPLTTKIASGAAFGALFWGIITVGFFKTNDESFVYHVIMVLCWVPLRASNWIMTNFTRGPIEAGFFVFALLSFVFWLCVGAALGAAVPSRKRKIRAPRRLFF